MAEEIDFCSILLFHQPKTNFMLIASRLLKTPVGSFLVPIMMAVLIALVLIALSPKGLKVLIGFPNDQTYDSPGGYGRQCLGLR